MVIIFMVFFLPMIVVAFFERNGLNTFGGNDARPFEARGLHQTINPPFELKPVNKQKLGLADRSGIRGGGLIDMRIPVGTDKRGERDIRPADTLHHIADDRKGRDDRDRFVRLRKGRHSKKENQNGG